MLNSGSETSVELRDPITRESRQVQFRPTESGSGVDVVVPGYGDGASVPGAGVPVYIEFYGGELRINVWADIASEDPTHMISLEGAREDAVDPQARLVSRHFASAS